MAAFEEFLSQLLDHGKVIFRSAKPPQDRPTGRDVAILAEAYATLAISVAGPPVTFDPRIACEAAELVRQASWALVSREERVVDLKRRLRMSTAPASPAQHLSADLMLRYVPQILESGPRNRSDRPCDRDPRRPPPTMAAIRRPVRRRGRSAGRAEFGRHPGLLLLYAERLAANDRPAWRPDPSSPAYDYYDLLVAEIRPIRATPQPP